MTLKKKAISSGFWSAISSGGLVALQLVQVLVLTRYLSKEEFGLFAIAMIVLQMVSRFSDLGIGSAIIQRPDPTRNELSSLYWLNVIFGLSLASIMGLLAYPLALFFDNRSLLPLFLISALTIAIVGIGQQFNYLLQKALNFRILTVIDLVPGTIGAAVSIYLAMGGMGATSILLGVLVNYTLRTSMFIGFGIRMNCPRLHFSRSDLKGYMKFGGYLSAQRLVSILAVRIDSLLIAKILGPSALGLYFFSQQFTSQVYERINPIFTRVAFPIFSQMQDNRNLVQRYYCSMIQLISILIMPSLLGLGLLAAEFLEICFTPEWAATVRLIQILAIVAIIKSLVSPAGTLLMTYARTDVSFFVNLYALFQIPLFVYIGAQFGLIGVALSVLLSTMVLATVWMVLKSRILGLNLGNLFRALILPVKASLVMGLCVEVTRRGLHFLDIPTIAIFAICVVVGVLVYAAFLWIRRSEVLFESKLLQSTIN